MSEALDNPNNQQSLRPFRGHFMDVIHPSSDVNISDKTNYAPEKPLIKPPLPPANNDLRSSPRPSKDFADDLSSTFEPIGTKPSLEGYEGHDLTSSVHYEDSDATEDFKSPFLPNVKVDKRPLGSSASDSQNIPGWLKDFSQIELPADDSAKGELEPELLAVNPSSEPRHNNPFATDSDQIESDKSSNVNDKELTQIEDSTKDSLFDVRAALDSSITNLPHNISSNEVKADHTNYLYSSSAESETIKKHIPNWILILTFLLLVITGGAIGAILYFSGWLN